MDIQASGETTKVIIELHEDNTPKTCDNFKKLIAGIKSEGHNIGYKGTSISRVVDKQFVQCGNIRENKSELKSCSSFSEGEFADECFTLKHSELGIVGMC